MPDIRSAMEALTLTNHFTINPPGNELTKLLSCMHLERQRDRVVNRGADLGI